MPWSATQQKRLGFEKNLLEKYFRNRVTWIDPTGNTRVEVRVSVPTTSNTHSEFICHRTTPALALK